MIQDLNKEQRYDFMKTKAIAMDKFHKNIKNVAQLDFFIDRCLHIDMDNSIFKIKGIGAAYNAINETLKVLDMYPKPGNFRLLDYAKFSLAYGFINLSYGNNSIYEMKNVKLTTGDPKANLEFFQPLDIFGDCVSFYDNMVNYNYLAQYERTKKNIIEKIVNNELKESYLNLLKDDIAKIKEHSFIPKHYFTDDDYSIEFIESSFEDRFKQILSNTEDSYDDTSFSSEHVDNTINFIKQNILEKEAKFNNKMIDFRNWIKAFVIHATKILNPLISLEELNSIEFVFNEKGTSLETFKVYAIEQADILFKKLNADYKLIEHLETIASENNKNENV